MKPTLFGTKLLPLIIDEQPIAPLTEPRFFDLLRLRRGRPVCRHVCSGRTRRTDQAADGLLTPGKCACGNATPLPIAEEPSCSCFNKALKSRSQGKSSAAVARWARSSSAANLSVG